MNKDIIFYTFIKMVHVISCAYSSNCSLIYSLYLLLYKLKRICEAERKDTERKARGKGSLSEALLSKY